MDKGRHPNVVRTWTVERTKVPYRPAQPKKSQASPRQDLFRGPEKSQPRQDPAPKRGR